MSNKILTAVDWQERVRAKLRLSANQLPDADIEQPEVVGMAEALVTDAVPMWEDIVSAGGNKKVYLESAVVNYCCALLCPSMSQRLALVKGPLMSVDYGGTDWTEKASEFMGFASADIGRCNDAGNGAFKTFKASGPTRAGGGLFS